MTTIPKNSRKIPGLKDTLTACRVFTLDNYFRGRDCDPACAWKALADGRRTKLTADGDARYVVHVHSNLWYELTPPAPVASEGGRPC